MIRQSIVPKVKIRPKITYRSTKLHRSAIASKSSRIVQALSRKRGASLEELCVITGWQRHSVRGHLSGTLRKKGQLTLRSEVSRSGIRRYRIICDTGLGGNA